jgi:hypothetical protein
MVLAERSAVAALNDSLGAPSPRALEKLIARIEGAAGEARERRRFDLGNWLAERLTHWQPRTLALAGVASALVAMVEAGFLTSMIVRTPRTGVTYETPSASGNATEQAGVTDGMAPASRGIPVQAGAFLLIALRPEATAAQIQRFLESYNASIVDGPKPGGIFRIRVSDKALAPDELRAIAASMRKESGIVRLVAPTM